MTNQRFYDSFIQWDDAKLLEEYAKKDDYQQVALDSMKQIIKERGLLDELGRIDIEEERKRVEREEEERLRSNTNRERHIFVTCWFAFILVVNFAFICWQFIYLDKMDSLDRNSTNLIGTSIGINFFNIIFVIVLFSWKKWGAYGFILSASCTLLINYSIGNRTPLILGGMLGVLVLFIILNTVKKNGLTTWDQMD